MPLPSKKSKGGGGGAAAQKAALREMMKAERERQQRLQQQQQQQHSQQPTQGGAKAASSSDALPSASSSAALAVPASAKPKSLLKKPKYSSAVGGDQTANSVKPPREPEVSSGLASLMAGYDDSDSSDDSDMDNGAEEKPSIEQSVSDLQHKQGDESEKKSAQAPSNAATKTKADSTMISAAASVALQEVVEEDHIAQNDGTSNPSIERDGAVQSKNNVTADSTEKGDMDEDTWAEFQDLVGGDDNDVADTAKINAPLDVESESTEGITAANKDGDEERSDQKVASAPTIDSSEVEQAAYEARLGRLMMLRAKKKSANQNDEDDTGIAAAAKSIDQSLEDVEYASVAFGDAEQQEDGAEDVGKGALDAPATANHNDTPTDGASETTATFSAMSRAKALLQGKKRGSSALAILKKKKAKLQKVATDSALIHDTEFGEDELGGFV